MSLFTGWIASQDTCLRYMSNACRVQVFLPQQRVSVFIYTIPPDLAWLDLGSVVTRNFKGVFAKDRISTCRAGSHVSVTVRYV